MDTLEQLVKLQDYDTRISDADKILAKIPEQLKSIKDECDTLAQDLGVLTLKGGALKQELEGVSASSVDKKELLENAKKKKEGVHNSKEYEAALKEIDNLEKAVAELDAKKLLLTKDIEETEESRKVCDLERVKKNESYISAKAQKEDENKSLVEEVSTLRGERDKFAAYVHKGLLTRYEKVRTARAGKAVVSVDGEFCSGCRMKIPSQLAVDVKKRQEEGGKDPYQCPHCQRFLYHKTVAASH